MSDLLAGESVYQRSCLVCGETIKIVAIRGKPFLDSCSCRRSGKRDLVALTSEDVEVLVKKHKHLVNS